MADMRHIAQGFRAVLIIERKLQRVNTKERYQEKMKCSLEGIQCNSILVGVVADKVLKYFTNKNIKLS